jgi:hypothetical protein
MKRRRSGGASICPRRGELRLDEAQLPRHDPYDDVDRDRPPLPTRAASLILSAGPCIDEKNDGPRMLAILELGPRQSMQSCSCYVSVPPLVSKPKEHRSVENGGVRIGPLPAGNCGCDIEGGCAAQPPAQ